MRNKEGGDEASKSNFFQRAWYRMSGRKLPRKRHRPRSMSEPTMGGFRRKFSRSSDKKKGAHGSELSDSGEEVVLKKISNTRDEYKQETDKNAQEQVMVTELPSPTTPPGYEIMDGVNKGQKDNNAAEYQNMDAIPSPTERKSSTSSPKEEISNLGYEFMWSMAGTSPGETAEDVEKEKEKDQTVTESLEEKADTVAEQHHVTERKEMKITKEVSTVETRKDTEAGEKSHAKVVVKVREERERSDLKISVKVDEDSTKSCLVTDSKVDKTSEVVHAVKDIKYEKGEKLVNGETMSDQRDKDDKEKEKVVRKQGPPVKERPRKEKSPPKVIRNNGDLRRSRDNLKSDISETNKENFPDFKTNDARPPRGLKNPPPEIITPNDQNSYVNTDAIAYVNIPVKPRRRCATSSIQTTSKSPANSGDPYAIYDSNENDTIYHSVESLLPDSGRGGYQNIRSSSFESIIPTYQNLGATSNGRGQDASYVNMPVHGKRRATAQQDQFGLNYVKLDTLSSSTPSVHSRSPPRPSVSTSNNSPYTFIDQEKTELLKQTAQNRLREQKEKEKSKK